MAPQIRRGKRLFGFLSLAALLEMTGNVFPLTDVHQQSIEAVRRVFQGLLIGLCRSLQHLIEAVRRSLQFLKFFPCVLLLRSLSDGPNQAGDSFPEIACSILVAIVTHCSVREAAAKKITIRSGVILRRAKRSEGPYDVAQRHSCEPGRRGSRRASHPQHRSVRLTFGPSRRLRHHSG